MPKQVLANGKLTIVYDETNPQDMKKQQQKTKSYQNMSKPDLVKLVEVLIKD